MASRVALLVLVACVGAAQARIGAPQSPVHVTHAPGNGVLKVPLVPRPGASEVRARHLMENRLTLDRLRRLSDTGAGVADAATALAINGTFIPLSASYLVPQYAFPITAGTPPATFYVVPDSGSNYVGLASGITEAGFRNAAHQYNPSASSTYEEDTKLAGVVDLQYGGGGLIGTGGFDVFGVGDLVAKNQGFVAVHHVSGSSFIGAGPYWEGIWGLCFQGLYQNASNKFGGPAYFKPMLQTLFEQKALDTPSFGFYLSETPESEDAGEIQFGAPDTTRYTGDLHYVDILPMHPNRTERSDQFGYWLHAVDGVSIDGRNISACEENSCYGFVDTGGPLLNVPLSVAAAIVPYVHINSNCSDLAENPTISMNLGGKEFPLTPEDYVYKITDPETGAVTCELGVNVLPGASNYLFQIGDTFLRKYYAYFVAGDKMFGDNPRIGYAPAVHA